ncbi:RNA 2'-phosphotransferase [Kribbella capetownensis]|uniref:RNA 2'-phosphotransferase n=1 Tax=Kribbella capetownensis TaxID=1572659 RepID=A0A4R0JPE9_9ACTN|nr:tRNA 2'-phosphotransferase [Kribbella capetownensis]TCC46856.1 RNA 2'-phosphotransferase [Kribbella capetownensis]
MSRDSRRISRLLRHTAGERGLTMSADGWSAIADVLTLLELTRSKLDAAVRDNNKQRLQVDGERIRACQGHSRAGMPVTREALENSWERVHPDHLLWHGTNRQALPAIQREGLKPGRRTHVHLAPSKDSQVGRRTSVEVLLGVDPSNLAVYRAPNGVLLTREVPPDAIVRVDPDRGGGVG